MHLSNSITEIMEEVQPLIEALGSIRFLWTGGSGAEISALHTFPSTFHMTVVTLLLLASLRSLKKVPIGTHPL